MNKASWRAILSQSITTPQALARLFPVDETESAEVIQTYPMRINPYFLGLIGRPGDPIYKQCIPDIREIKDPQGHEDPLSEEAHSPTQGLTHRYPDRVLFLVSDACAVYCRFCNRKRKVGRHGVVTAETIQKGLSYIRSHKEVRDVLLSGGDPLLLGNRMIHDILDELRSCAHLEIIRIGTRVPCTLPQRITPQLLRMLKKFHPLYIQTHFNHPDEITTESSAACGMIADAGIPLGCQTVLLKGINDDPIVIKKLMQKLLSIRVRPYYLFQADLAKGTSHFWTPLEKGLEMVNSLQGHTSGLCVPHFAVDLVGGGGKVPLLPEYILETRDHGLTVRNYEGKKYDHPFI